MRMWRASIKGIRTWVMLAVLGAVLTVLITALVSATRGADHPTWGPFRGRFVDADTGEPIRGAVAYAIWLRTVPNPLHPTQTFDDVQFAVSNDAGEFEIPARRRPLLPFGVEGPIFDYIAPQYQLVDVRDDIRPLVTFRKLDRVDPQQRRAVRGLGNSTLVPHERVPTLLDEINTIRLRMGLPPFRSLGGSI